MFKRLEFKLGPDGNIVVKMKVTISTWIYKLDPIHCAVFNFLSLQQIPPVIKREGNCVIVKWILPISLRPFIEERYTGCDLVDINF